jgi:ribosome-associated protein YbcJ (S4-like RNA binding protein)
MNKKDPLAPVSLKGKQAKWFVDYLEGKIKIDPKIDKRRRELLRKAESLKNPNEICIEI